MTNNPNTLTARRWHSLLLAFLCIWLASGCAMSPQTITIRPVIKAPSMPVGHGRKLQVETVDQRRDTVIGTLGGVYQSAHVSTDQRMETSITQEAVKVLQSWDFIAMPTTLASADTDRFTIEVLDIDYQRPNTAVAGNVIVKCRVAVKVERGSNTYSGEYRSQRSEQVAVMGTVEGNRRIVNETVNQALTQIFLDSKLQRFLAR